MAWLRSPYGAWMTMRLVWFGLWVLLIVSVVNFVAGYHGWSIVFCVALMSLAAPRHHNRIGATPETRISPVCDQLASLLSTHNCPNCGQSSFDHTPASGYAPDVMQHGFWPLSTCANCGTDLSRRPAT